MSTRLPASAIHPEFRTVFRFLPNPPIRHGWMLRLLQSGAGRAVGPRVPEGVGHRFVRLGEGSGVHVFTPSTPGVRPALLWIHGGGLVMGSALQDHGRCIALALELDIVVVSAEYRLAPRHPYPAALDDCRAAWGWTIDHADDLGIDAHRVAVGGQSAGGGLAAALVLRLHDEAGAQPVAQWLFCPMLDDRTAADRGLDAIGHYLWNNTSNRVGWTAYLGVEPGSPDVASHASPGRRDDLTGLPPAWIGAGDIELFHDEIRDYADRLGAAGVPCELDVVPGGPHAFESMPGRGEVARAYRSRAERWLAARFVPV